MLREIDGDIFQVVDACPANGQPLAVDGAAAGGEGDARRSGQVLPGDRGGILSHRLWRALGHDLPAEPPPARAKIHHPVGGGDQAHIVLDQQHGVAQVAQGAQHLDQAGIVARVQTDGRLIQHVEHAGQPRAEQGRQPQPLRLARRERGGGALEGQVAQANLDQPPDALLQIGHDRLGDQPVLGGQGALQPGDPPGQLAQREPRDLYNVLAGDAHHAGLGAQARPGALGAGLQHQHALKLFQVIGILVGGVLGVAAQQVGDHALEAAFGHGVGRFDLRVVAAENRAVDPVEQQVTLSGTQLAQGHGGVEIKAVVAPGGAQRFDIPGRDAGFPEQHRPAGQALFLVKDVRQVGSVDGAHAGAGRAGPGRLVEGEEGHAHLGQQCAAVGAGNIALRLIGFIFIHPHAFRRLGRLVGGRDVHAALETGAVPDAGEQHAQVGVDFGDGADG